MLAEAGPSHVSRRSTHKSTSGPDPAQSADERERPTPDERVQEFKELYPEKADTFLLHESAADPREPVRLRREATEHYPTAEYIEGAGVRVLEGEFYPLTWAGVLRGFLEWFEGVRDLEGKFTDGEGETWTKRLLNSYHEEYLETHYAKLMGLHREVCREWENPQTALLSLTSSGGKDRQRGPVDHQLERREAWGPTYKRLYDRMEALVEEGRIRDWMYVVIEEHHPGPFKRNTGYGHDHPVVVADGELRESDFFDVIDTWVAECSGAEHDAHDYRHPREEKRPIKTRRIDPDDAARPDVMNSAGGYLTKYLYPDGGSDPMERDIEMLAHQSIKWATNTRRLRKSDRAGEAIAADLCRQRFEDDDDPQGFDHAERLEHRGEGRGPEIVCQGCGSSWGIDAEAETVVEATAPGPAEPPGEPTRRERLARAWGDAPTVVRADAEGVVAVERPPPTRLEAYVVGGEEYPADTSGGGVELVPVRGVRDLPMYVSRDELRDRHRTPPGGGHEHPITIADGDRPPPEGGGRA